MLPRMKRLVAIGVAIVCGVATPAFPCSVTGLVAPEALVERATVIVHARAERQTVAPGASSRRLEAGGAVFDIPSEGRIEFRVVRALKGPLSPGDTLTLRGRLESVDDLNAGPVPYTFVRRGGQRGDCFASNYREAGDYLLLLNRSTIPDDGPWTARWSGLSPTNEQLRGPADPWLAWVAQRLK